MMMNASENENNTYLRFRVMGRRYFLIENDVSTDFTAISDPIKRRSSRIDFNFIKNASKYI